MTFHTGPAYKGGAFRIYIKVILFLFIVYRELTINLYPLFPGLLTLRLNRLKKMMLF